MYASGKARAWIDWDEKKSEVSKIVLPFQAIETTNEPRTKTMDSFMPKVPLEDSYNLLIWGDNKLVMSSLMPKFEGRIDLIYIDPPFATGTDQTLEIRVEGEDITKQPSAIELKAYYDTWGKGLASYLQMMSERLLLMHQLLSNRGSIYVHLDSHVGHYVKILMDGIFGPERFLNEISWRRGPAHNDPSRYGRNKDTILFYSKTENWTWNSPKGEVSEEHLESFRGEDEKGKFTTQPLHGPAHGQKAKPWRGIYPPPGRVWAYKIETLEELDKSGLVVWSKGRVPRLKKYLHELTGAPLQEIWTDIPILSSHHKEHTGFPTQKPRALLERILSASSNPGDLVADFFCGSGTTMVVAENLGRRWVGCDLSKFAVHIARKRLLELPDCKPFQILNLGMYQKQKLMENGNGGRRYFEFIRELYGASPVQGFAYIHGRKGNRLIHIGPIDSFVSEREIRTTAREALNAGAKGIDILGWDFEMGLHDLLESIKREYEIDIKLKQIPLEVLEIRADERAKRLDEIRFFDLNYLDLAHEVEGKKATVVVRKFSIANPEFIPENVRSTIKDFKSYIDFWAVDFDFRGDTFHNMRQHYRTRDSPDLKTMISYEYPEPGTHSVLVKVVDIFGNDTNKLIPNVKVS